MAKHSQHVRELTDILRAIAQGQAGAAEFRRFLKRQYMRGVPLHRQVMETDGIPDEIMLVEAHRAIRSAGWMRAYHDDAKAYLAQFAGNQDGFAWDLWLGGEPA